MTKELTVGNITFNPNKPMPIELLPNWMIVNSVRYALGRQTSIVSTTCDWLILNWNWLGDDTRLQIKHDIEDAFSDYSRCKHLPNLKHCSPLGGSCDIKEWSKVRELWKPIKNIKKNKHESSKHN
jgi:hypothetical protein